MIIQHLIVEQRGAFVHKHSERLCVKVKDETIAEAPLMHLESVMIATGAASVSAEAIRECAERGIPIHFVSGTGEPYASLYASGLTATVLTRRAQIEAFRDERGLHVARAFCKGKILNQMNLLKYAAKYRKENAPAVFAELQVLIAEVNDHDIELDEKFGKLEGLQVRTIDDWRFELLSIEGRAAQKYWAGVKQILPADCGWPGREGRGATDSINCALNYGYGVLYGQVERALVLAGLDPYAGFIHVDRPGKPSLTLDLIEEFRQAVVDRTIMGLVNKGVVIEQTDGKLEHATRRLLAEKVLARLESAEPYAGKRLPLRAVLQSQARQLAAYLRQERPDYVAFVSSW